MPNFESIEILLAEDNPGDARLAQEALRGVKFVRRQAEYASVSTPDLVLLDLNLPRKDGREVLAEIKKIQTSGLSRGGYDYLRDRAGPDPELPPAR